MDSRAETRSETTVRKAYYEYLKTSYEPDSIVRIEEGKVVLDFRTIFPAEEVELSKILL